MKFIKLFIVLILTINFSFAIEKSSINLEKNPKIVNTKKNIKQAESIEKEVVIFKKKLEIIQKKYNLIDDLKIKKSLIELQNIIYILRKIQTTKIEKSKAEYVIKIVINHLKNINLKTKKYLKNYKYKLDTLKNKYIQISTKLELKFDKITKLFINYYKNKKNITNKDKKIIKVVIKIYKNNKKIKEFKNKAFYTKESMKEYLIKYFNKIKDNFKEIKKILKNK